MSDDKTPLEQAIDQAMDAFVYAPIGLLFDGPELFPKLAERGRNQVTVARMMGEMAVQMGQSEAGKRMSQVQGPLKDALTAFGVVPPPRTGATAPAPAPAAEAPAPKPTEATKASRPTKATKAKNAKKVKKVKKVTKAPRKRPAAKRAASTVGPDASSLGIPDYDSLSASQVVKRLDGMPGTELDAVKAYEAATRARKTILNRITQLQKG